MAVLDHRSGKRHISTRYAGWGSLTPESEWISIETVLRADATKPFTCRRRDNQGIHALTTEAHLYFHVILKTALYRYEKKREFSNAIKRSCMHTLLEHKHTAALWLTGRETLGPKKMRVIGFQVVLESKPQPTALLAALLTLLALIVLLTLLIILLALLTVLSTITPLLPLAPRLITDLTGARILRHH